MQRSLIQFRNRLPRPTWELSSNVENLMSHFFGSGECGTSCENTFLPETNIVETETGFEISVELPGLDQSDVHVELHEGQLIISGEKKPETEETEKTYHRVERRFGEFRRVVSLPIDVDEEKVEANFRNGVLLVALPKSEKALPKQVEVKTTD